MYATEKKKDGSFAPPPMAPPPPAYGQANQQAAPGTYAPPPVPPPPSRMLSTSSGAPVPPGQDRNWPTVENVFRQLEYCVADQGIASFYPSKQQLRAIAERVVHAQAVENIAERWNLPLDRAIKLVKLALFDIVIYVDDSASMERMEGGQRVQQLQQILSQIAFCTALLDDDGIDIEFINAPFNGTNIRNAEQVHDLLFRVQYKYNTRLGTQMRAKILDPFVRDAQRGQLRKPLVVITITDGEPQGEPRNTIFDVILKTDKELRKTRYGRDAISYQFAQVGNDRQAQDFLGELDEDRRIGDLVDCTSRYELEAEEWMRKTQSPLSREEWLAKLLLGPVDTSYDSRDETLNEATLGGGLAPNLKRGGTMKKLKGFFR